MSLIPDRYECSRCGRYALPASLPGARTLSSRCRCDEPLDEVEYLQKELEAAKILLARFQGIHESTARLMPEAVTDVQQRLYAEAGACLRRPIYTLPGEAA